MKERYFKINGQEKEDVFRRIERFLEKYSDLIFAYVHGSFVSQE